VATKIVAFELGDMKKKLSEDRFSLITTEELVPVCKHVKEIEKTYIENEHVMDNILEYLFINIWFGFGHKPVILFSLSPDTDCRNNVSR
jgi:hypothetical protein